MLKRCCDRCQAVESDKVELTGFLAFFIDDVSRLDNVTTVDAAIDVASQPDVSKFISHLFCGKCMEQIISKFKINRRKSTDAS